MNNQQNNKQKTASGTNIQKVKQQNANASSQASSAFGTEFGSETDVQQVKQQNAQSQANKNKSSK